MVNGPEDVIPEWDAVDLAVPRGQRTAAAAADLQGGTGTGSGRGQEPAEVDAAKLEQHAAQRAAGDAAQRWSQDGRDRWAGRADLPDQDGAGGAGASRREVMATPTGQAGVHTQGG